MFVKLNYLINVEVNSAPGNFSITLLSVTAYHPHWWILVVVSSIHSFMPLMVFARTCSACLANSLPAMHRRSVLFHISFESFCVSFKFFEFDSSQAVSSLQAVQLVLRRVSAVEFLHLDVSWSSSALYLFYPGIKGFDKGYVFFFTSF